jgi:hypothetical protein
MFGIADIATAHILQTAFKHLASHPNELYCILGFFGESGINSLVGPEYIKEAVKLITGNKIFIGSHYNIDERHIPSITVMANYAEDMTFLGDAYNPQATGIIQPRTIAAVDAHSVAIDSIIVSSGYGLMAKVWPGLWLTRKGLELKITGIKNIDQNFDEILFDRQLTDEEVATIGVDGWKIVTDPRLKGGVFNTSVDKVTIICELTTTGDLEVHRAWAVATRWALKWGRGTQLFHSYNIMNPIIAQTPPTPNDGQQPEFKTQFTISAQSVDTWLIKETESLESIGLSVIATNDETTDVDDVEIGDGKD